MVVRRNLQLAVGAYFDLTDDLSPSNNGGGVTDTYSMNLVTDLSSTEETCIPPFTKFFKVWRIRNSGNHAWPPGSFLRFKSGKRMFVQEKIYLNPPVQVSSLICLVYRVSFLMEMTVLCEVL